MANNEKVVINLRFNQDQGCFTCCMENKLRIYNVDPLIEQPHKADVFGSLSICEMLDRTNILALVGGVKNSKLSDSSVIIYDDNKDIVLYKITFTSPVKAVRMRQDEIIVATISQINVFTFPHMHQLFALDTKINSNGLCEVSPFVTSKRNFLIYPGYKTGSVKILDLAYSPGRRPPITILAHKNDISCIAINQQGLLMATASSKGTLIRVWDTVTRNQVAEFRRGADPAIVYCINFSQDSEFLCCSSDKGTIHIFALKDTKLNKRSTFSNMGFLGNYVESQWALATFTVPPERACICAFGPKNSVIALCIDGTYHKYIFNEEGGCNRHSYDIYLNVYENDEF